MWHQLPRRLLGGPKLVVDAGFALLLTVVAEADLWMFTGPVPNKQLDAVGAALVCVLVALRRIAPVATAVSIGVGLSLLQLAGGATNVGIAPVIAMMVAMYTLGAVREGRRSAFGAVLVLIAMIASLPLGAIRGGGDFVFIAILTFTPWAAGRLIRNWEARARHSESRTSELEAREGLIAQEAVTEERARIARELHDVVAQSVGVMVVQAAGARRVLERNPERARGALVSLEETGRDVLDEMHRLLGILRDGELADSLTPQPSLREIGTLAEQFRTAGLPVSVQMDCDHAMVPPGIELAAYRIIQEALTNALKHAGSAATTVQIRSGSDLWLRVENDRPAHPTAIMPGAGHGLIGMRERVALYGGELRATPTAQGGFAIDARLPLRPPA